MPLQHQFDLDTYLPRLLSVVAAELAAVATATYHKQFGISSPEWRALSFLGWNRDVSINAVSIHTSLDKVAASRAVAKLVAAGLVRSESNPDDARLVMLKVTPAGRRIYEGILPKAEALEQGIRRVLGADADDQLRDLLIRLHHALTGDVQRKCSELTASVAEPRSHAKAKRSRSSGD